MFPLFLSLMHTLYCLCMAQTATSFYEVDGTQYLLNLIDTPGHVDFSYEVSCSLAACQGTLLVVDATQGVQAQTLANFYLAFERDVSVTPSISGVYVAAAAISLLPFFCTCISTPTALATADSDPRCEQD